MLDVPCLMGDFLEQPDYRRLMIGLYVTGMAGVSQEGQGEEERAVVAAVAAVERSNEPQRLRLFVPCVLSRTIAAALKCWSHLRVW